MQSNYTHIKQQMKIDDIQALAVEARKAKALTTLDIKNKIFLDFSKKKARELEDWQLEALGRWIILKTNKKKGIL